MTPANAVAACAQIAFLVAVCAPLPRMVDLRSPGVQYVFWRVLLAASLLLPILAPRRPAEMVFVPAVAVTGSGSPANAVSGAAGLPPATHVDWLRVAEVVIVTGAAVRLAWIALGLLRLRRMRAHARE